MNRMRKVLVTGGCGAIGSEVINYLKRVYPQTTFINLDALTYAGNPHHIEPPLDNYQFVYGNICDPYVVSYVLETERPEAILHFAAETHVDNSFGNSLRFTHTNVLGTHVLLECVRQYKEKGYPFHIFLHMSTDEVYGSVQDDEPARQEGSLFFPSNPYAAAKAGAEMICHAYQKSFGIPLIITRCNNAISKYQHEEKLIPRAISCIQQGTKVPIHGEGKSKRTFIHVYDIARALETILDQGEVGKVYNIGSAMERTVLEVVDAVLQQLRPGAILDDWIEFVPDRVFQDYRYCIDTTELRKLGWQETVGFEDAIRYAVTGKI